MAIISDRFIDDTQPAFELSEIQKKYIRIFIDKCSSGEYSFEHLNCECGCNDFETIAKKDRYGIPVETVICRNCGLIMTNPCLDSNSNNAFYDNEYHYIYRSEDKPSDDNFVQRKNEANNIIEFVRKHAKIYSGSVLEIGCADGGNVAAFNEAGYNASGIDLSHVYVNYGIEKGLNLYCSDAKSFAQRGDTFDLVVLNHVLEHFTHLKNELEIINSLLNPGGFLFIAVPGLKYLTFGAYNNDFLRMLQNAHIFNFSKDTLCQVMKKYGFDCIYANEFIYSVFIKGEKSSNFTNFYSENLNYLQTVEKYSGDKVSLIIIRAIDKILSYPDKRVILYGTAEELDILVQSLPSVDSVKGFFYSDSKTPTEVIEYIQSSSNSSDKECLVLADAKNNKTFREAFYDASTRIGFELFSIYSEIF